MLTFLSLGSNVQPQEFIPKAIDLLKQRFTVKQVSTIYETQPVGPAGKKSFWNLVVSIETHEDRETLTAKLRSIEAELGRMRSEDKFAPRTLDIDILPQPDYQDMAFIIIPLAEIAPEEKDSQSGKTFKELAAGLQKQAADFKKINLDSRFRGNDIVH